MNGVGGGDIDLDRQHGGNWGRSVTPQHIVSALSMVQPPVCYPPRVVKSERHGRLLKLNLEQHQADGAKALQVWYPQAGRWAVVLRRCSERGTTHVYPNLTTAHHQLALLRQEQDAHS